MMVPLRGRFDFISSGSMFTALSFSRQKNTFGIFVRSEGVFRYSTS